MNSIKTGIEGISSKGSEFASRVRDFANEVSSRVGGYKKVGETEVESSVSDSLPDSETLANTMLNVSDKAPLTSNDEIQMNDLSDAVGFDIGPKPQALIAEGRVPVSTEQGLIPSVESRVGTDVGEELIPMRPAEPTVPEASPNVEPDVGVNMLDPAGRGLDEFGLPRIPSPDPTIAEPEGISTRAPELFEPTTTTTEPLFPELGSVAPESQTLATLGGLTGRAGYYRLNLPRELGVEQPASTVEPDISNVTARQRLERFFLAIGRSPFLALSIVLRPTGLPVPFPSIRLRIPVSRNIMTSTLCRYA